MRKEVKQILTTCRDLPTYTLKLHNKIKHTDRPEVLDIEDAKIFVRKCYDEGEINFVECCYVIALNASKKVMGVLQVSKGGVMGTVVDPRIIYTFALLAGATSIIITHNHPSGSPKPSSYDETLTKVLLIGAKALQINLIDHIIITEDKALSFNEEGLLTL